ncbi:MAG: transglycosylase SLT domain-containing protein [Bacteroidales bacterium]|nr:transglycosylase SLT domain-containing protein [Bacteroidales bacterium]
MRALYATVASLLLLLIPLTSPYSGPEVQEETMEDELPVNPGSISPYDHLIRHVADSIGWDWRLLSAVVYHESRFHNEAQSHKGAVGLMQILSSRYTTDYLLNPAANLTVGSRYLLKLENMFRPMAANDKDAVMFALAAYNVGEGRVRQLIRETGDAGEDATRWAVVSHHLPKGHHTVSYVENVLDTYAEYARTYPR